MRLVLVLLGLGIAGFCLRTAFQAFRSPILHPWWWTFVCVLCAPVTSFNIDTGALSTNVLSGVLFGIGYWHALPNGPTVVQTGFPVGALLFLQRRRRLIAAARPMLAEDQVPL